MELKKYIQSITIFTLGCCSLILMMQGCSQSPQNIKSSGPAPEPKIGVEEVELKELIYKSKKPYVLLNFFATWCKPCRTELPELVALNNDPSSEVTVLLVSIDNASDAKTKLQNFLGEYGVNFQTYARPYGEASLIKEFYPNWNRSIPLSLLYNNQGQLLEVFSGMTDRGEIEVVLNRNNIMGVDGR